MRDLNAREVRSLPEEARDLNAREVRSLPDEARDLNVREVRRLTRVEYELQDQLSSITRSNSTVNAMS